MSGCCERQTLSEFTPACGHGRSARSMLAAALGLAALATGTSAQPQEARMSTPVRVDEIGPLSPAIPRSGLPGPFQPRGSVLLYSRINPQNPNINTGNFGSGGNPDGSGVQPDVWFDDVPIAQAFLQGGGITCPLISVCQIVVGIRQFPGSEATDINVWWTTVRSNTTLPDTAIDTPPQLAGTIQLPMSPAGALNLVTIGDGVNPIAGMSAVPLNMGFLRAGGVPATFGTLAIGVSISNTTDVANQGWRFTSGPDANADGFWIYDTDLASPEGLFSAGGNPITSFFIVVRGTPVVPATPQACCVPSPTGSSCFIAADVANCTLAGGNAVPGLTACGANACTTVVCCNNTTGICSVIAGAAACPGTQVIQPGATSCAAIVCAQPTPPGNDECAGAAVGSGFELTIPANPTRTDQTLVGATTTAGWENGVPACTLVGMDVWYRVTLTPAQAGGQFQVTYTGQASTGDFTVQPGALAVYAGGLGCPAGPGGEIGCVDWTNPNTVVFNAGGNETLFVRVAFFAPGTTRFDLSIAGVVNGACCNPTNGLCVLSNNSGQCTTQPGYTVYMGDATTCAPNPCPRGACCGAAGACAVTGSGGCDAASYLGDGSTCTPNNNCAGACCNGTTGGCTLVSHINNATECAAPNVYRGQASTCAVNNCVGACCAASGACTVVVDSLSTTACVSPSTYSGGGTVCLPNTCAQPAPPVNDNCVDAVQLVVDAPAIAGNVFGATQDATPAAACTASVLDVWYKFSHPTNANLRLTVDNTEDIPMSIAFYTTITPPATDPCGTTETSCAPALDDPSIFAIAATGEQIVYARVAALAGGFTSFTIKVERIRTGACCESVLATGACVLSSDVGVCAAGTVYQGDGSVCQPNPCPQPANGVCCRGSTCVVDPALQSQAACAGAVTGAAGGTFVTTGTCGGANHLTPCCYSDYNKIGGRNVSDIFAFLSDWFAARPWAVVGGDGTGTPAVSHIFTFLTDWFGPVCP